MAEPKERGAAPAAAGGGFWAELPAPEPEHEPIYAALVSEFQAAMTTTRPVSNPTADRPTAQPGTTSDR